MEWQPGLGALDSALVKRASEDGSATPLRALRAASGFGLRRAQAVLRGSRLPEFKKAFLAEGRPGTGGLPRAAVRPAQDGGLAMLREGRPGGLEIPAASSPRSPPPEGAAQLKLLIPRRLKRMNDLLIKICDRLYN
jgi:hypothetical protein